MSSNGFPLAVCEAIGGSSTDLTYMPCLVPYTGIKLLEFVGMEDVGELKVQMFPRRSIDVYVAKVRNAGTLMEHVHDCNVKSELQGLVDGAGEQHQIIGSFTQTKVCSLKLGIFKPTDPPSLSFSCGEITTRSVSEYALKRIIKTGNVAWDVNRIKGVVTAIYIAKGGLKFSRKVDAVTGYGVHFSSGPYAPVTFCAGWKGTSKTTDETSIELPADDQREWIIAIRLHRLENSTSRNN